MSDYEIDRMNRKQLEKELRKRLKVRNSGWAPATWAHHAIELIDRMTRRGFQIDYERISTDDVNLVSVHWTDEGLRSRCSFGKRHWLILLCGSVLKALVARDEK